MRTSELDYVLPPQAVAQEPVEPRHDARLLVDPVDPPELLEQSDSSDARGDRPGRAARSRSELLGPSELASATVQHRRVRDLPALLRPGDVVVVNDTRVAPARLHLRKPTGGRVEVLVLTPDGSAEPDGAESGSAQGGETGAGAQADSPQTGGAGPGSPLPGGARAGGAGAEAVQVDGAPSGAGADGAVAEALVRPGRRVRAGTVLLDATGREVLRVEAAGDDGIRRVQALAHGTVAELLADIGEVPLPPYVHRPVAAERYQTVYARQPTSVAAPTAGLHFTGELLQALEQAGISVVRLDLAVSVATFRPVVAERLDDHVMHTEHYRIPDATWAACAAAQRVVAVGTTVVRALESAAATGERAGRSNLFIRPGHRFAVTDVLLTNFHLPRSTLLALLCAFVGERWRSLYETALAAGYRFGSFGDAMLVHRRESIP